MSTLLKLQRLAENVIVEYHERSRRAEEARERETSSVIKLQAAWRSFLVRKRIQHITKTATTIQRYWRGYLGRLRYRLAREAADKKLRKAFFDAKATEIQRVFRGWWSRKYIFDFASRRAFLGAVAECNAHVRQQMVDDMQSSTKLLRQQAGEAAKQLFETRISKLHHLVSTSAIPGVFNSPYAHLTGTVPKVAGKPLEKHFKASMKKQVASLPPLGHTRLYQQPTGDKRSVRLTLRQSTTYDLVVQEQRMEKLVEKSQVLAQHSVDFMNIIRSHPPFTLTQSIRNCERYHDPWDPTIGNRTDSFDTAAANISPKVFNKYPRHTETFQDSLEQPY